MTKSRHPSMGRATGSQEFGLASSPASWSRSDAWNVNFNNGNSNANNRDNNGFVRAVRSASASEYQSEGVTLRELFDALQRARRGKVASENQLAFETQWIDGLITLQSKLNAGTWSPGPTTCFVAQRPKARQIHAPDFGDRVVHHWLVPLLEAIFEPGFIFDSFANRTGKGTHAAVDRLRQFVHQVDSGKGGGWYLQLDIHNFFNSIDRRTLYNAIKRRVRARLPDVAMRAAHALLRAPIAASNVVHRSSTAERARVPAHKRLENAAPGCGLPIGNLSSQFFANVYLDALDQFVKRTLKAKRYLRYVDDFVLVHHDRQQLAAWQADIEAFLRDELRLKLKADIRLRPLSGGIDFLGYVVYPTHTRVRSRVVRHAFAAVRDAAKLPVSRRDERLRAVVASYVGHFSHANAFRLTEKFHSAAKAAARG